MFKFYIGSCLFCFIFFIISSLRIYSMSEKKDKSTINKTTKLDKLVATLRLIAICLLPLVNIFYGISFVCTSIFINDEDLFKIIKQKS